MGPRWWPLLWCLHAVLALGTILAGGQRPQETPPRGTGWSPGPLSSWVPTPEPGASSGDPEGLAAALGFLQTGDTQRLARANCSRGVAAGAPGAGPPPALRAALRAAAEALAHAANFLNMLFQTNDIREASVAEDVEWYQALVRSLVEGHPWVRRAVLALDAHPLAAKPRLMLQATKGDGEILLQDVSAAAPSLSNLSWDNEWFNALKSQRTPLLRKRLLSNDLRSMETPKWQRGDSYVGDPGHVRWSPPFLECRDGKFLPAWAVTLSSAFYGLKPDLSPEFKGVVRLDVELRDVAIDQCASGPGWFADTHRCDLNSTQCVPQESHDFVLGRYLCRCRPGFYGAGGAASGARAGVAGSAAGGPRLSCRPCRRGCATCEDDAPCLIQEDRALRAAVLSCQACCMLAVFLSMLVSYHFRRSKRIRASGVVLLETILFGSLLLYFPVFILYFKPSIFRCIVLRWVRMLGFAIVYGTITLKLYRVLKVFLSRTAQRVPYVSSGRVLKMLGLILLLVLWFLAAWTIGMLENIDKNIPLVIRTQTARGLHFYICGHDRWDYMMVIAEILFLLWGSFLCYATRAVPSAFHEPRYMGIALHNELMISAAFHVVRFIMVPSLHPDWTLLLFFAHTHGTITMTLALLFIPKFLHAGSPLREEIAAEVYEDELDMRRSGSCLNSSIASAWSEHSLDPDDIREELKKLYAQLEVHKTRRMAANNPHLPKKRSSRRSLGRSIVRRVAELPEAVARRSSGGERGGPSPAHRGSSAKRFPDAAGTSVRMRDEGSRRRAAASRKSRSTEGPAQEPRGGSPHPAPPREPGPERKTTAATASEPSDSESLDDAPLVCKSASAHNLAGHGHPPPRRAAPLQKSLSVVTSAREKALLAARRAARGQRHPNWHPSGHPTSHGPPKEARKPQSLGAADALAPAGSRPAEGGPQEDMSPLGDGKAQKHVTYAPIKSISTDSSHLPGRARVSVRRIPPPPPVRYQSLGRRAVLARHSPEPAEPPADPQEPPTDPPAGAGEPERTAEGSAEEDPGRTSPPVRKGRLLAAASIPAQVCPWELVQEEILSRKQKATEAADSGTPREAAAAPTSLKPPSQRTSLRSLGLAIKAFNRVRGKGILKVKREGEGSLRKRECEREGGSRKERPSLVETAAVSLGGAGQDSTAKSPERSQQRPGSESPARPEQGDVVPGQRSAGWGDSGVGQRDSPAPGTSEGEKRAEEPSAPPGSPLGVCEVPPSVDHQEGAEEPQTTPAVASSSEKAPVQPREGAEAAVTELGKDVPAASARPITPKEEVARPGEGLDGASRSICPQDGAEVQQPHAKPVAGIPEPSSAGVQRAATEKPGAAVRPRGAPGVPGGRGALLRQGAVSSREDTGVPPGEESPATALEKGGSQPEPLSPGENRDTERISPRSRSVETAPGAAGKAGRVVGRQAELCSGETQAGSSIKIEICPWEESRGELWGPGRAPGKGSSEGDPGHPREQLGAEKPRAKTPELLQGAVEKAESVEGRRAEVCPWETGEGGRTLRAEICPWDAQGAQHQQEKQEGEQRQLLKRDKSIRPKSVGLLRAQESRSSLQAPGQPWGSASSKRPPPKPAPKSSELPEVTWRSPRASVCPWEVAGADSDAQVCPWERGTLPDAGKLDGKISQVKKGISPQRAAPGGTRETAPAADKGSSQRGSPCPGEGAEQPSTGLAAKLPALPTASPKQGGTLDSKKADICPWEVGHAPLAKTEICPREEPATPSGKERLSQDTGGISGSRGPEDMKAKLAEMGGCQSENRDTRIFEKLIEKSTESSKAEPKKPENVESIKVCPWESLGMEQPPEKPHTGSPALPKSPSKKSQSAESLKAEVCPWELETTLKAEICPWEAAASPSTTEKSRQDKDASSNVSKSPSTSRDLCKWIVDSTSGKKKSSSREHESVCPRESLGMELPPEKPHIGSPALPKSPSSKSQSAESLKAEVCPWEAQELEAPKDKAEICPWEAAASPSTTEKSRQDKDASSNVSKSPSTSQGLRKKIVETMTGKKEKASRDHESVCSWESTDVEGSATGYSTRSLDLLKATLKKWESKGRAKVNVHPQESLGMEMPPEKPHTGSPALPKSPSSKSQSAESLKAEVCPWEAQELETTNKSEICPWEVAASPSTTEKSRQDKDALSIVSTSPSVSQGLRKIIVDSMSGKKKSSSREHESVCPRESLGMELPPEKPHTGSPALPKSPSSKSQSAESLKAEVCPWEAQELEAPKDKAEICPWEVAATPSEQQKAKQGPGGGSKGDKRITRQAALASPVRSPEKGSSEREAVCPWESLGMELPPEKPHTGSPALPKSPSSKSQSAESLKAEVCPWEAQELETTNKAEICPWEAAASPSTKEKSRQDKDASPNVSKSPSIGQGLRKKIVDSMTGKKGKASREHESVCPQESLGIEQPPEKPHTGSPALPKSPSSKSQSAESLKAEVCPWELETTNKAEICPWEAAASPSTTEKSRQDKDALSIASTSPSVSQGLRKTIVDGMSGKKKSSSRDHESVCPRESLGMELPPEKPHTGSPALPKSPSSKSQSAESLKAEVCPWEAQELETANKAEICPWEAAASPSTTEKSRQDKDASPKVSKSPSIGQGLRKKIVDSMTGKKGKASREHESVCPRESLGMEMPPEKPHAGSPALPKSPSSKSQSAESLKAEVCPWEAQELEAPKDKAEICPWEAAATPSEQQKAKQGPGGGSKGDKRITRQAALASPVRSPEKGSSEREAVCPWESLGMELPPEKPHTGSPALPKSPSSKSQSAESLKAEVCPWEAQELETTNKAEICPWEAAASPSTTEKSRQDKDASPNVSKSPSIGQGLRKKIVDSMTGKKEKSSREHESICPRESLGMELPPEKPRSGSPALPKSPSSKSQSAESLKAEVCPWEAQHVESSDKAEICPWEVAAPLPEKGAAVGKASLPPSKLGTSNPLERGSSEQKAICPWESLGMEELSLKAATGKEPSKKSEITESKKSDICPWEAAEATFSKEESCKAGVHPLGADGASPIVSGKSEGAAGASPVSATAPLKKSKDGSECKAQHKPLCRILPGTEPPWGPRAEPRGASTAPAAGSGPSPSAGIAEVCPWEAEEAPPASDKTSTDPRKTPEVCPWEVQSVDLPPTLRGQGRAGASPHDGVRGGTETKPDVCPWVHE
ncbi:putative G-protein coupled receptor 179 [Athene noctua]|uniref:putative G-protein coupled receptor 179 n=1 Tax=Athene noctua TaxID=126797 RepID=UPI003EC0EA38